MMTTAPRQALVDAVLDHLLADGRPEQSLRSLAQAVGVGHSLLLYHFGSTTGLLGAVHLACEQRQRDHLAAQPVVATDPLAVMRAMWTHLADPRMWPVYRLGFALRVRADIAAPDQQAQRDAWTTALTPLITALGPPWTPAADESLLWVATCRGLLWELVTGADPAAVDRAAHRFFAHYAREA